MYGERGCRLNANGNEMLEDGWLEEERKKREDLSVGNGKYLSNWKVNDTLELRGWCVW